jgi:hypothetical protein
MANPEHLAKLKEGVEAWNKWRAGRPALEDLDLRDADLAGRRLRWANLSFVNFLGANLRGADLRCSFLTMAILEGANLRGADISAAISHEASFRGADLTEASLHGSAVTESRLDSANLSGANLAYSDLRQTVLAGANLTGASLESTNLSLADLGGSVLCLARIGGTTFAGNDLSNVEGLESVKHHGPSTIGIDTLILSGGKISESFLRGCGVPDEFITFTKSLATSPLQFYSCFISYSTKDQDFADRLYADLQNKGVRCWFAPHDVQGGRKLHEQIDEAIRLHDKLLLILSPHSMESEWVKTEIAKARKREVRDQRRVLFPIRLAPFETLRDWECFDADTGKDSAREIREYFIPDFSNWKNHDSYQEAFQRLISDLKASDTKPK